MFNRKFIWSFTLAEVLITLGIIGVVAALTIPGLLTKIEKNQLETQVAEVASLISQGTKLYLTQETESDKIQFSPAMDSASNLENFIMSYFKVAHNCHGKYLGTDGVACFANKYSAFTGEFLRLTKNHGCEVVVTLVNGISLCVDRNPPDGSISFEVDLNGTKPPNVWGKDYQVIQLKDNGTLFDQTWIDNGEKPMLDRGINSWTGTFGQIVHDNWKIKYY